MRAAIPIIPNPLSNLSPVGERPGELLRNTHALEWVLREG